jgi:NADPH:quinone reductase
VTVAASRRAFDAGVKVIGGAPGADPGTEIRAAARLELARLAEEGKLRVVVEAVYPLAQVADAHRALAAGHSHGKIVLVP